MRRISAGPIASVTSATALSGTGRSLPGLTIRLRTSSIDAARVSTLRTSTSIFLSRSRVARRDFAAHAVDDAVGDVAHDEPELRGALLVEHDLDLGIAGLDGRLDVGEARIGLHAQSHLLGGVAEAIEVVARDHDLERRRER